MDVRRVDEKLCKWACGKISANGEILTRFIETQPWCLCPKPVILATTATSDRSLSHQMRGPLASSTALEFYVMAHDAALGLLPETYMPRQCKVLWLRTFAVICSFPSAVTARLTPATSAGGHLKPHRSIEWPPVRPSLECS